MSDASFASLPEEASVVRDMPRHIAIIMDGNGRWAEERGLPRAEGHRKGVDAVRKITKIAGENKLNYLTLYSFSSENWNRPESEITELFSLLRLFIRKHLAELHQNNVRMVVIGQEAGIPSDINCMIQDAVNLTANNTGLTLVIAFNYGSRGEITEATKQIARDVATGSLALEDVTTDLIDTYLQTSDIPDPDLIIRTSGEKRLSNFLLWQAAYSEFVFVNCNWPDFGEAAFFDAISEYYARDRRFGAVTSTRNSG